MVTQGRMTKLNENPPTTVKQNVQASPSKTGPSTSALLNNPMVATTESIKLIADSVGIANLNEEAVRELSSDLTFIVKSILTVITVFLLLFY